MAKGGGRSSGNGKAKTEAAKALLNGEGFDQGGPDGPKARQKADGETPGEGHNSQRFDGAAMKEYLETMRSEKAAIEAIMTAARLKCQPHVAARKAATKAMVSDNYPSTELALLVRKDAMLQKIETIDSELDDDQKLTFAQMEEVLGDFASTGLGAAALAGADVTDRPQTH